MSSSAQRGRVARHLLAWLLFVPNLVVSPARGQVGERKADSVTYRVRPLPAELKLSQSQVSDLVQDEQGFIWMATQYGLDRYDGIQLRVFLHSDALADSIGCTYIKGLFRTSQGRLWIRCGGSVDRYEPRKESFSHVQLPLASRGVPEVFAVAEAENGLLLGTSEGIYSIASSTRSSVRLPLHSPDQYWDTPRKTFCVGQDQRGRWWMVTSDRLAQFDPTTGAIIRDFPSPKTNLVGSFHQDRWGTFWLIAGYRLYRFDEAEGRVTAVGVPPHAPQIAPHSMIEDHNGDMWFATENAGVIHYSHSSGKLEQFRRSIGDPSALPSDRVTNVAEDRSGDIWVGFHDVPPVVIQRDCALTRSIRYFPQSPSGLHSPLTTSITALDDRELLIATSGALQTYDEQTGETRDAFPALSGKDVFDTYRDSEGLLWMATDKGVARSRPPYGKWEWPLVGDVAVRFLKTKTNGLWILARSNLFHYDAPSDTFSPVLPAARNEEFYAISEAPDHKLWIGGTQGLHGFEPETRKDMRFPYTSGSATGPSDPRINSVLADQEGSIWVGTQNGLDRFDVARRRFELLAHHDQLGGQIISCILQDDTRRLWMSSNQGVLSYDILSKTFDEHSSALGSTALDLSGWGACTQTTNGQFLFGGFGGVIGFSPGDILKDRPSAGLLLTSISVNNQRLMVGDTGPLHQSASFSDEVRFRHDQNDVAISFTTFNYRQLNKPRYEYQLSGVDETWLPIMPAQSTVSYSHLTPGDYTLRFRSAEDGPAVSWHDVGQPLRLIILPPWWKSWWMYLLYAVAIGALARAAWIIRVRQLRAVFAARMEGRIRERTALARDIHDTLLQDMQGMVLNCESISIGLGAENVHGKNLSRIIHRAEQSISEGRDALQAIRTTPLAVSELMGAFQEVAHDLAFLSPARIEVTIDDGILLECPLDAPEIFKIGREALRNALQHSQAANIRVRLSCKDRRFSLEIVDDGIGIIRGGDAESARSGHWGIIGMKERAERIGGNVSVESVGSNGTTVRLTIPVGNEDRHFIRNWFETFKRWVGWSSIH